MSEHKKLVVLCDGTWNKPTRTVAGTPCPTNVTKLAVALAHEGEQGVEQRYASRGGTGNRPGERLRAGLTGFGLSREVQRPTGSWCRTTSRATPCTSSASAVAPARPAAPWDWCARPGSSARSTPRGSGPRTPYYRRRDVKPADPQAVAWRERHSHPDPRIRFIGVWDTAGALGIPWTGNPLADLLNRRWSFHDTQLSSHVEAAFQALRRYLDSRPDAAARRIMPIDLAGP